MGKSFPIFGVKMQNMLKLPPRNFSITIPSPFLLPMFHSVSFNSFLCLWFHEPCFVATLETRNIHGCGGQKVPWRETNDGEKRPNSNESWNQKTDNWPKKHFEMLNHEEVELFFFVVWGVWVDIYFLVGFFLIVGNLIIDQLLIFWGEGSIII